MSVVHVKEEEWEVVHRTRSVFDEKESVDSFTRTSLGIRSVRKECAKCIPFALTHVFSEASVLIERTAVTVDLNFCSVDFFFFTDTVDPTSLSCLGKKATREERGRWQRNWKVVLNKEGVQGPTRQRPDFREAKHAYRQLFKEHVESTRQGNKSIHPEQQRKATFSTTIW